jgi:deoxyribonuclease IV
MLIGGHVSTAGGLHNAIARGEELECDAIQIFNQSPRMWRPTKYGPDDFDRFREEMEPSRIDSVVIHAIYLINPASGEKEMRRKSLNSLVHALEVGAGIGADGVVVHPGALKTDPRDKALKRAIGFFNEALERSEGCKLILENNAGSQQLLGLHFEELAAMIDGVEDKKRIGVCLDSCHLFASGHDIRTPETAAAMIKQFRKQVGTKWLTCLHLNDSMFGLGDLRDRHADIGTGEIGRKGFRAFLAQPAFQKLPALLETPGPDKKGQDRAQVRLTKKLAAEGVRSRGAKH